MFDETELDYLKTQRLVRIATVGPDGQPDVSPVGFSFDGKHFWVSGRNLSSTRKYKDIVAGCTKVALVIDDLASVDPWRPRGVRVYGEAEIAQHDGHLGPGEYIKVTPTTTWSWGLAQSVGATSGSSMKRTDWTD
jgi:pyridoxamine 5'-phosphate oxidase family protein